MSKAVMLSIRPKWCEKIASGEKTIEVRKTRPKLDTPFKCYIYCTKGKVIGEFTCEWIYKIDKDSTDFIFKAEGLSVYKQVAEEMCGLRVAMTDDELHGYLGHCQGYGWHITDLKIYDAPRKLSEFTGLRDTKFGAAPYDIKRAPQSWCYVEEV